MDTSQSSGNRKRFWTRQIVHHHKAQEVVLEMDIIEKGREGDRAIVNYNNPEGWLLYKKMSDNYANKIREIVRKYKNKNDKQR